MAEKQHRPGVPATHPGELLREIILPALNMNATQLAAHLGVSKQTLSELMTERRSVSLDMAQRLGQAFGNGTRFWLAMQMNFDIWQAEQKDIVKIEKLHWEDAA
jgi:addiction module HigA family antidote